MQGADQLHATRPKLRVLSRAMLTVDERQAEHIRDLHRSLAQMENCLLHWQLQVGSMLREIQRLHGGSPVPLNNGEYE